MSTSNPPRSLRPAYGNALHTKYTQLDFGDTQKFERTSRIGEIYSQPCPPCAQLAKHRVPGVEHAFEFPVTNPDEIKEDGTLKQAHEVAGPRTRWSNARCSAKRKHCQKHAWAHEMYEQDETGWKRPAPDFSIADEAGELYKSAEKVFLFEAQDVELKLDAIARGIAERANKMDKMCMGMKPVGDSVAARHDATVVADLTASVRDAELRARVLCQMSAEEPAPNEAAEERTSTLHKIIAHAEEMKDRALAHDRYYQMKDKDAPRPKPLEPFKKGGMVMFDSNGSVERIASDIARFEMDDPDLAEQVYPAVKKMVPYRIKAAGEIVLRAVNEFRNANFDDTSYKGKSICDIVHKIALYHHPSGRYVCVQIDARNVAEAIFPLLHGQGKRRAILCGSLLSGMVSEATAVTAQSVIQAAKSIGTSNDEEVKELASALGYTGELQPMCGDETLTTDEMGNGQKTQLTTAAIVAAILRDLLLSEMESVVSDVLVEQS